MFLKLSAAAEHLTLSAWLISIDFPLDQIYCTIKISLINWLNIPSSTAAVSELAKMCV